MGTGPVSGSVVNAWPLDVLLFLASCYCLVGIKTQKTTQRSHELRYARKVRTLCALMRRNIPATRRMAAVLTRELQQTAG